MRETNFDAGGGLLDGPGNTVVPAGLAHPMLGFEGSYSRLGIILDVARIMWPLANLRRWTEAVLLVDPVIVTR